MNSKKFLALLTGNPDAPRLSITAIVLVLVFLAVPVAVLQLTPRLMRAAGQAPPPGQDDLNLAMAYILTDLNDRAAVPALERAAAAGNAKAMLVLGVMYTKGEAVPRDMDKARSLLEEPARLKYQTALNVMGIMAVQDGDLEGAWRLFDDALEHSTVIVYDADRLTPTYWLGYLYSNRQFSRYNLHAADMYMARAAQSGREDLQLRYAAFLVFETMDYGKAIPLLETLAAKDNVRAKALTAYLHAEGYGYEKDCARAFDLAADCADRGSPLAMTILSDLYRTGCGVPRDPELARVWAEKARDARE